MNDETRKKVLLGALGIVVVVALAVRLGPMLFAGAGGRFGLLQGRGGDVAMGERPPEVAKLHLAALEAKPEDYKVGRDPFRFGGPSAAELAAQREAERRRLEAEAARRRALAEAQAQQAPQPVAAEDPGPQPPPIDLTYLGSFGPEGRPIAVFVDGDDIYNAFVGDVVEGKFVVDHIGFESVDLKYVDFPDLPPQRLAVGG